MTLYEIEKQLNRLLELPDGDGAVDTETGEVFSAEAIQALDIALDEKIEGCGVFCKSCAAEIETRKKEIKLQQEEIKRLENKIERTMELVKRFVTPDRPFKSTRVSWKWKINPPHVEIAAGLTYKDFSPEWLRVKEPEIDKTKIKEALKNGVVIKGATLESEQTISYK